MCFLKYTKAKNNVDFLTNLHYFCMYMINAGEFDKLLILMDLDFVKNDQNNIRRIVVTTRHVENEMIREKNKYLFSLLKNNQTKFYDWYSE